MTESFDADEMRAQMARLEQMLTSLHDALGVPTQRELPNGNGHAPEEHGLELASAYRPSSVRFDPSPVSYRVAAGAPLTVRTRRGGTLLARLGVELAFLVLVVVVLAILHVRPLVVVAGAGAAWVAVVFVEFLLSRSATRVVEAHVSDVLPQPAPSSATVGRPQISSAPLLPDTEEPVDAVASETEDVWVVPHEFLLADPVDEAEEEPESGTVVLEDTLETDPPETDADSTLP